MKAAYGKVGQVKDIPSQGITRIIVEMPIEAHIEATSEFYGRDVLVTHANGDFGRYGIVSPLAGASGNTEEPPPEKSADWANTLYRVGWWNNPQVLEAFGSDADFLAWIRIQLCCIKTGGCDGDVVAAHVRRIANGAGTGIKPAYSAIPMCDKHHTMQHRHGESAVGGKEAVDRHLVQYRAGWIKSALYAAFQVGSLTDIAQHDFIAYCSQKGLLPTLPNAVRLQAV